LVLAAGSSRRMGATNKLLVPIDGRPMVTHVVDTLAGLDLAERVVVTGHEAERVAAALSGRPLRLVHNDKYLDGMASSLAAGVGALAPDVDAVVVCLGDMPWVRRETIAALVAALDPEAGVTIAVPTFEGKRGNPVAWARRHFEAMRALAGDTGARELIARYRDEVAFVAVDDPGVLVDVDTEEALAQATRGSG
ncbi:MAG: nucleotidyltransferase family protein, partial [Deltaproteobacteria bacterium]|nr:nucleotidyltransferase family protein [Deltaproteobacteria bacterium]